jgi:hypothetical protein
MISLIEIIKDNDELHMLKKQGSMAKKAATQLLTKKGLEEADYFILRIKESSKLKNWVALYRTHSIMSGRPIFWINSHLPEIVRQYDPDINMVRVMVDNILHEWWHAICDAFRASQFRNVPLKTKVSFRPDQTEEDMAEKFIAYCGGDTWGDVSSKEAKYFADAIQEFNGLWR